METAGRHRGTGRAEARTTRVAIDVELRPAGTVVLGEGDKLEFPHLPSEPGIYQVRLVSSEKSAVYIGESDDLRRRMAHYRNPGPTQPTNLRINERIHTHIAAGDRVEVSMATEALLELECAAAPLDLARRASRLLVENAVLVTASASGVDEIENL